MPPGGTFKGGIVLSAVSEVRTATAEEVLWAKRKQYVASVCLILQYSVVFFRNCRYSFENLVIASV